MRSLGTSRLPLSMRLRGDDLSSSPASAKSGAALAVRRQAEVERLEVRPKLPLPG